MRPNFSCKLNLSFLFLTLFVLLTAYSLPLNATIRYVSKTGTSIPPYTSWETAADSIQKCINISVFGDTIYVANGVYEEQVIMIPGLSLIGAGLDSTIINTQALVNSTGFVAVEIKDSCLFRGFKIIVYYNNDKGYGVKCNGNCIAELNRVTNAGGGFRVYDTGLNLPIIYKNNIEDVQLGLNIFNSNAIVRDNNIATSDNIAATIIAGIYVEAYGTSFTPIIDSNYIEITQPIGFGIRKNIDSSPTITNNVIKLKNGGSEGIRSNVGGTSKIFNNLIIAEPGYDGINKTASNIQVIDNYLMGNFGDYGILFGQNDIVKNNVVTNAIRGIGAESTQNIDIRYNNSWNNGINYMGFTPDSTNISVDPMIINDDTTQGELDFHLQKYSPLIDTGDPNILDKDSSRSDIGLYGGPYGESYIYYDLPPRPPVNLTASVDSSIITLKWNKNTEADFSHYNLFYDTTKNFQIDSTKLITSQTDTFYYFVIPVGVESLYFKLTAVDNQGNESNPSEEVAVILVSVKNEWKPVNNYILYQNYPNPFNPSTKIGYKLRERGYVKLYVYDVKGELVSVLVNQVQEAGYYEVEFSAEVGSGQSAVGKSLASGVYIYQIMVSNENNPSKPWPNGIPVFSDIKKMVFVK
jgi:hypothetical protein